MKNFREWREEKSDSSELLLNKIDELTTQMQEELRTFEGERFEGFLELIGGITELRRNIAAIKTGSSSWFSKS